MSSLTQIVIKGLYFFAGIVLGVFFNGEIKKTLYANIPELELSQEIYSSHLSRQIETIHRSCYSLNYDCRTKNASWVYEKLTPNCLEGTAHRDICKFMEDSEIPEIFRATLKDYKKSGFDRGHLAPAANHKDSQEAMKETFLLSNMSPQCPRFNQGYWSHFENMLEISQKSIPLLGYLQALFFCLNKRLMEVNGLNTE